MNYKSKKIMLYFITFSIIVLCSFLYIRLQKEGFTAVTPQIYDIIILAGQSNSLGRGKRNHLPNNSSNVQSIGKISDDNEYSAIKQLGSNGTIVPGIEPIVTKDFRYKSERNEIGHGLSFAKQYLLSNPNKKILLLGCGFSVAGSSVLNTRDQGKQWKWDDTSNSLFNNIYTT